MSLTGFTRVCSGTNPVFAILSSLKLVDREDDLNNGPMARIGVDDSHQARLSCPFYAILYLPAKAISL